MEPQISEGLHRPFKGQFIHSKKPSHAKWLATTGKSASIQSSSQDCPNGDLPSYEMIHQHNTQPAYSKPITSTTYAAANRIFAIICWGKWRPRAKCRARIILISRHPIAASYEEEQPSLVASARREVPLEAEIIPEEVKSPRDLYPNMTKLVAKPKIVESRFVKTALERCAVGL